MSRLFAGIRNRPRVGAMRRGRSCVRRRNGEMVQAAFDRIARCKGRVVAAHRIWEEHTSRHACGLVGPVRGAGLDGNVTETFANRATKAVARRTCVHTMGVWVAHRLGSGGTGMVNTTAKRISRRIGIHARRESSRGRGTARVIRILRIGARAVGLHVGAVFLCCGHHAAPTCTSSTAAGTAGTAFARAGRRSRTGGVTGFGFFTADGKQGRKTKAEAYEKNTGFSHSSKVARICFRRQVQMRREIHYALLGTITPKRPLSIFEHFLHDTRHGCSRMTQKPECRQNLTMTREIICSSLGHRKRALVTV